MDAFIEQILSYNKNWAAETQKADPEYFLRLAGGQKPKALIIACSDSRVSPNVILGADLGEIFVHRNIANVVSPDDPNLQSVLQFSIEVLRVKHIIIIGHYDCGGVEAALSEDRKGPLGEWLRHIRRVIREHKTSLDKIRDPMEKARCLVELNVTDQIRHIHQTTTYRKAREKDAAPELHGWVYDFHNGLIKNISTQI